MRSCRSSGAAASRPPADAVLERFAVHEAAAEAGPYRRYRDVLAAALRGVTAEYGVEPTADEIEAFSGSVGEWPAFSDTAAALARLKDRFKLGVITNCDDDLFAASLPRLGVAFDWVVTAQQVGAYKPSTRNFEVAFERMGLPRDRILHVAQSLFHDHAPAHRLGSDERVDRSPQRPPGGGRNPAGIGLARRDLPRHGLVRGGRDRLTQTAENVPIGPVISGSSAAASGTPLGRSSRRASRKGTGHAQVRHRTGPGRARDRAQHRHHAVAADRNGQSGVERRLVAHHQRRRHESHAGRRRGRVDLCA